MDEDITTTLSNALVESPEYSSTMWTIPDDIRSQQKPRADILAMPERLNEVPEWLRTPLRRFLRLKQRNWPAKTVQRSTRQLFNRLKHMISFFIQHYEWIEWKQFSPRWLEDYIDARLRRGIAPGTINWDLIYFRAFCQFLIDEGFDVPTPILKLKVLDTPPFICRTSSPIREMHTNSNYRSQNRLQMDNSSQRSGLFLFVMALRIAYQRSLFFAVE